MSKNRNLAGVADADRHIADELRHAKIDQRPLIEDERRRQEVPATIGGVLGRFTFWRAWYYWIVRGPVPLDVARGIYADPIGADDVRVAGHCGCPPPDEWARDGVVDSYHIDSVAGLRLFADAVRDLDRPAPTTAQLDLDALDRAAKTTSDRGVFVEDGAIYAYDGDACFRVGSAENAAAEEEVAAAIVVTLDAAPHLIAEARAAVALRQELSEEQASRARLDENFRAVCQQRDTTSKLNEVIRRRQAEAKRLGLEACDAAREAESRADHERDGRLTNPRTSAAIRAELEAL